MWGSGRGTITFRRYDYLTEYVQVLRDLWGTGSAISKAISSP